MNEFLYFPCPGFELILSPVLEAGLDPGKAIELGLRDLSSWVVWASCLPSLNCDFYLKSTRMEYLIARVGDEELQLLVNTSGT